MTTITINTYDPAGRFDFDDTQAEEFFSYCQTEAKIRGHAVEFVNQLHDVDNKSARFVTEMFQEFNPE